MKQTSNPNWRIIGLCAAFVLCLLVFAVSFQPFRAAVNVRALRNRKTRSKAARILKSMGITGRMALLDVARHNDDSTGSYAQNRLREALKEDIEAGRDIEPIVRRAIIGMSDPGDAGRLCAVIASEGWALGMLDEETKGDIAEKFAGVTINARPEYPVGVVGPSIYPRFSMPVSRALRFEYRCIGILDGREKRETRVSPVNSIGGVMFYDITAKPGRHTLQGKIELELVSIDIIGPFDPSDEIGWKTTLESDVVEINVRDDLPDDYLQAEVTPELEKRIRESVKVELTEGSWSYGGIYAIRQTPRLRASPPLPCDLAYRTRWQIEGTNKVFEHYGSVLCKGADTRSHLELPPAMVKDLDPGKHLLTFKVVLEPSLEEALSNPKVEAYWPRPIELPPFTLEVEVKPRDKEPREN